MIDTSRITDNQRFVLEHNPIHLVPLETLSDGDILLLDRDGFGPYILTLNGHVHAVDYHYKEHHGLNIRTRQERENE